MHELVPHHLVIIIGCDMNDRPRIHTVYLQAGSLIRYVWQKRIRDGARDEPSPHSKLERSIGDVHVVPFGELNASGFC